MSIFYDNILINDAKHLFNDYELCEDVTVIKSPTTIAQATPNAYFDGINGQALISVTVADGGSGYGSIPTVAIQGGTGTGGATATATVVAGVVTVVTLTAVGSYITTPKVVFSGGNASLAAKAFVVRNHINAAGQSRNMKYEELEIWLLKDATLGLATINTETDKITAKRRLDKAAEDMRIMAVIDECPAFWRLKVE